VNRQALTDTSLFSILKAAVTITTTPLRNVDYVSIRRLMEWFCGMMPLSVQFVLKWL